MQPWWENLIDASPIHNILGGAYALVEAYGGTVPKDFLKMREEECYIEFEDEKAATLFLLRWA